MTRKDSEKVIKDLTEKPFIYSRDEIITDSGYVIISKEYYEKLIKKGAAQ